MSVSHVEAKVHKSDMPMRPVLSMPGSVYYNVAKQVAKWLSVIPECQINCSTKSICDSLGSVKLEENEELVSFDVVSLYTNQTWAIIPLNSGII